MGALRSFLFFASNTNLLVGTGIRVPRKKEKMEKPKVYLCSVIHEWKRYNEYESETTVVGIFSTDCAAVKAGRDYMEYLILKHIDNDGHATFYDEDEYKVVIRDFVVDNIVV